MEYRAIPIGLVFLHLSQVIYLRLLAVENVPQFCKDGLLITVRICKTREKKIRPQEPDYSGSGR